MRLIFSDRRVKHRKQTRCREPKDNEKDLEEISKEITDGMEIVPVERFSQVEKIAFVK